MQLFGKFWQNHSLAPPPGGLAPPHAWNPGSAPGRCQPRRGANLLFGEIYPKAAWKWRKLYREWVDYVDPPLHLLQASLLFVLGWENSFEFISAITGDCNYYLLHLGTTIDTELAGYLAGRSPMVDAHVPIHCNVGGYFIPLDTRLRTDRLQLRQQYHNTFQTDHFHLQWCFHKEHF